MKKMKKILTCLLVLSVISSALVVMPAIEAASTDPAIVVGDGGLFQIVNVATGKYLTLYNSSNNLAVALRDGPGSSGYSDTISQTWRISMGSTGTSQTGIRIYAYVENSSYSHYTGCSLDINTNNNNSIILSSNPMPTPRTFVIFKSGEFRDGTASYRMGIYCDEYTYNYTSVPLYGVPNPTNYGYIYNDSAPYSDSWKLIPADPTNGGTVSSTFRIKNVSSGTYLTYVLASGQFMCFSYISGDTYGSTGDIIQRWKRVQYPNGTYKILVADDNVGKLNYQINHGSSYLTLDKPNYAYPCKWNFNTVTGINAYTITDPQISGYQIIYYSLGAIFNSYSSSFGNANQWILEPA